MLPNAGLNVYDVLRRRTLVLTKDAVDAIQARFQPRRRPRDGREPTARHYDTILAPVITEKATLLSEQNKVVFRVPPTRPRTRSPRPSRRCSRSTSPRSTPSTCKGKTKRFRGITGQRSDVKKAIVTLAEGQSIDITTGL